LWQIHLRSQWIPLGLLITFDFKKPKRTGQIGGEIDGDDREKSGVRDVGEIEGGEAEIATEEIQGPGMGGVSKVEITNGQAAMSGLVKCRSRTTRLNSDTAAKVTHATASDCAPSVAFTRLSKHNSKHFRTSREEMNSL
jgi:hypothetical protein